MAGSVNKVILIGNLGADPDVRAFPSGDKYCRLSVATNESWRDRESGEQKDKTEWHRVTVFNSSTAQFVETCAREARFLLRVSWKLGSGRINRVKTDTRRKS